MCWSRAAWRASIKSFPRGKLVFDQPLGMPRVGELWLEESTKEELLGRWLRIVRREQLPIEEGRRVTGIEAAGQGSERRFTVRSLDAEGREHAVRARRVLLATGRRGSPRRLPVDVPDSAASRVFYHLADARSFAGQRVVIVGLGDVAMEAAIALAQQPDTEVTLSYRGTGLPPRQAAQHRRGPAPGRQRPHRSSSSKVTWSRSATTLCCARPRGRRRLGYDALFVMIGSIPPWSLLEAAGACQRTRPGRGRFARRRRSGRPHA